MAIFEFNRPVRALAFTLKEVGEGTATWEYTVEPARTSIPTASCMAGVVMSLLDSAMGHAVSPRVVAAGPHQCGRAVQHSLPEPIRAGTISAHGAVVKLGKRIAVVEARAVDQDGRLVAVATATHSLLP